MELDEKKYLYLLFIHFGASFLYNLYWKEKQREFGDLEMVKKLSPESSVLKPVLKLGVLLLLTG
jgi:Ca-activated chloride channel family protein